MIQWYIDLLTKPKIELTALDEGLLSLPILIIALIIFIIVYIHENRK